MTLGRPPGASHAYPWLQLWNDDNWKCFLFRFLLQASDVNIQMLTWYLHLVSQIQLTLNTHNLSFLTVHTILIIWLLTNSFCSPTSRGTFQNLKVTLHPPKNPSSAFHYPQGNNNDHWLIVTSMYVVLGTVLCCTYFTPFPMSPHLSKTKIVAMAITSCEHDPHLLLLVYLCICDFQLQSFPLLENAVPLLRLDLKLTGFWKLWCEF